MSHFIFILFGYIHIYTMKAFSFLSFIRFLLFGQTLLCQFWCVVFSAFDYSYYSCCCCSSMLPPCIARGFLALWKCTEWFLTSCKRTRAKPHAYSPCMPCHEVVNPGWLAMVVPTRKTKRAVDFILWRCETESKATERENAIEAITLESHIWSAYLHSVPIRCFRKRQTNMQCKRS